MQALIQYKPGNFLGRNKLKNGDLYCAFNLKTCIEHKIILNVRDVMVIYNVVRRNYPEQGIGVIHYLLDEDLKIN